MACGFFPGFDFALGRKEVEFLFDAAAGFQGESGLGGARLLGLEFGLAIGQEEAVAFAFDFGVGDPGEGIEEAGEIGGVGADLVQEAGEVEVAQELAEAGGGELEGGFVDFVAVGVVGQVDGEGLAGAGFFEMFLMAEPVQVAAGFPVGEVHGVEVFDWVAEFLEDGRVGEAIEEGEVDLVAEGFGEAGDFAQASAVGHRMLGVLGVGFWVSGQATDLTQRRKAAKPPGRIYGRAHR